MVTHLLYSHLIKMTWIHWTLLQPVRICDPLYLGSARTRNSISNVSVSRLLSSSITNDGIEMAGNIIPAIATTNAMTAGLCVLQAFKVIRDDLQRAKMVFLERSAARVINTDTLKPPNPNCAVCGVAQSRLIVDRSRATLNDLVEDVLRLKLGYGDEFSIINNVGTLYDPDLDDNLEKKFSELGIEADSFLTVIDDDDVNPRVNLSLSISEKYAPMRSSRFCGLADPAAETYLQTPSQYFCQKR